MTMPSTNFNVPRGSFPQPINPIDVDPLSEPLVTVAFNFKWCAVIMGCLQQLLLNTTWNTSDQAQLTAIQEQVFDLMASFCVNPPPLGATPQAGAEGGEDFMLRQDPTNPCKLQTSVNGIDWCDWADISLCGTPPQQPGQGSIQPPAGGGQSCYSGQFSPSSMFLIPTAVKTGDVITVQSAAGAVSNSHDTVWHLATGNQFFAGLDVGFPETNGANPVPTAPTSSLIISFDNGSTWLPIGVATVTVPSGVSNVQPIIIVNDNNRSSLGGNFSIDVCVTNNSALTWCRKLDFTISPYGFSMRAGEAGQACSWVAGVGWVANIYNPGGATHNTVVNISRTFPASISVTAIELIGDGPTNGPCIHGCAVGWDNNDVTFHIASYNGGAYDDVVPGTEALSTLGVQTLFGLEGTTPNAPMRLFQAIVSGTGVPPSDFGVPC